MQLVTGGLGGLGLVAAEELVALGAPGAGPQELLVVCCDLGFMGVLLCLGWMIYIYIYICTQI